MKLTRAVNTAGKEFFQVGLVTYLLLTLAETLRQGTVSNFFNMNYLLLEVLVTGVAMVLTEQTEEPLRERLAPRRIMENTAEKLQPAVDWARSMPVRPPRRAVNIDGVVSRRSSYTSRPTVLKPRPKPKADDLRPLAAKHHKPAVHVRHANNSTDGFN